MYLEKFLNAGSLGAMVNENMNTFHGWVDFFEILESVFLGVIRKTAEKYFFYIFCVFSNVSSRNFICKFQIRTQHLRKHVD